MTPYIIGLVALLIVCIAGLFIFNDTARRYLDIPLIAFILPMVAAASITSHGTFIFYSYFLPVELAYAATIVLTVGIPLLEFAAVVDSTARKRYIARHGLVATHGVGCSVLARSSNLCEQGQCSIPRSDRDRSSNVG
jgi:hypothetical protein